MGLVSPRVQSNVAALEPSRLANVIMLVVRSTISLKPLPAGLQQPPHLTDSRSAQTKLPGNIVGRVAHRQRLGDPMVTFGHRTKPRCHIDPRRRNVGRRGAAVFHERGAPFAMLTVQVLDEDSSRRVSER